MSRLRRAAVAVALSFACLSGGAIGVEPSKALAPAAGLPPVKDFVRPTDFSQVSISPDGKYIAAIVPKLDDPHENILTILDGKTGHVLQAIPSGRGAIVDQYFWGDDDRLIATLGVRWNGLDTPTRTGELFAIDPDGTHQISLFGMRGGAGTSGSSSLIGGASRRYAAGYPLSYHYIAPDQLLIAVYEFGSASSGRFVDIERINVRTGKTASVGTSPARNAWMIVDHTGQVRAAYADNDFQGERLWLRKDNDSPWELVNDPTQSHIEITPVGFNRDNSKLYVRVAQGSQPDAVELMDVQTRQRTRLYQGKFADPGKLLSTADEQDYYAVETQDGRPGLHYFDEDGIEAQLDAALAKSFPGQFAYASSFTRDGKRAIVHVRSDRNPGDYYLFDLATRNAQLLAHARPWVNPAAMHPMEPVDIQARDGLTLRGFLTLPTGPKPYPLVVLPHGGPHGVRDEWSFDNEAQLLASRGYAVLQVNYRGSGGYGARFQKLGYRQWGLSMQDDVTDATRWAITQGFANASRVCIYGASYGGYAALEGAVREPALYKCAAGYAGVYDLRVQMDKSDTRRSDSGEAYLHLVLGTDRDDLLNRSPLSGVGKIQADILLMHGGADERVPIKNFDEFTKTLDQNGKHYEALVEPMEGHGFFVPAHREAAYDKLLEFLDRNIGPSAATAASDGATGAGVAGTH